MYQKFLTLNDELGIKKDTMIGKQNKTFRTSIDAYDQFGNVLFSKLQNNVVLGGATYVLEKLLNVRSSLVVADINTIINASYKTVAFNDSTTIPVDHYVCLWGVGIAGSGNSIGTVKDVKFYEREVGDNGDGSNTMVPFRYVNAALDNDSASRYFMAKAGTGSQSSYTGYYLKTFQTTPVIYVRYDDATDEGGDGNPVSSDVYNPSASNAAKNIEVYAEITLFLSKKDVREYFNVQGKIDEARINTIALFAAKKVNNNYAQARMITKLNFGNEMLENKEITFKYRIYTN